MNFEMKSFFVSDLEILLKHLRTKKARIGVIVSIKGAVTSATWSFTRLCSSASKSRWRHDGLGIDTLVEVPPITSASEQAPKTHPSLFFPLSLSTRQCRHWSGWLLKLAIICSLYVYYIQLACRNIHNNTQTKTLRCQWYYSLN